MNEQNIVDGFAEDLRIFPNWNQISDRAYEGCNGAKEKKLFEKYCVANNCMECPYAKSNNQK